MHKSKRNCHMSFWCYIYRTVLKWKFERNFDKTLYYSKKAVHKNKSFWWFRKEEEVEGVEKEQLFWLYLFFRQFFHNWRRSAVLRNMERVHARYINIKPMTLHGWRLLNQRCEGIIRVVLPVVTYASLLRLETEVTVFIVEYCSNM